MTDADLTQIYNQANGIVVKRLPLTTNRIFTAMRAMTEIEQAKNKELLDAVTAFLLAEEACNQCSSMLKSNGVDPEPGRLMQVRQNAKDRLAALAQTEEGKALVGGLVGKLTGDKAPK